MKSPSPLPWPLALALTAVAYAVAGWAALAVAIPPGYAAPLFPSAGIALAFTLVQGARVLPGVWLGSMAVNLLVAGMPAAGGPPPWVAVVIGAGAVAQAWVGARLVRRTDGGQLALTEMREIVRFFGFGALLACMASASVATLALAASGTLATHDVVRHWGLWWVGDALGTLIAAPIVLSLIGTPHALWQPRRRTVALPLLAVTVLAALAILQARRWDDGRAQALFERDVASATSTVSKRLQQPLHALESLRSLFLASADVSAAEFRAATQAWTEMMAAPQALGFGQWLRPIDVPEFEAALHRSGQDVARVHDRGADGGRRAVGLEDLVAVRYIEPLARHERTLGANLLAEPASREAIALARSSGQPAASAGYPLSGGLPERFGVDLFRALPPGSDRPDGLHGYVFVTLHMEDLLRPVFDGLPPYLQVCLVEAGPIRHRLAGSPGCERADAQTLHHVQPLDFGQRRWELHVAAPVAALPSLGALDTWLLAAIGLMSVASFGALLLTMSGRARRIEAAVEERTAALQREIAERARTEAALRDSEQRFRNILNHVPIGVFYTDLLGYIKQSNPKFRELVGYTADELSRMRADDFTHADDLPEEAALVQRLMQGDVAVFQRQKRYVRVDGTVLWVRAIVSLLRDAQGRPHRIVGAVEDITEHLKLEAAEAGRELAEAANRAKNDFLSRMSHELRTPLNAMLGFAQLVELDRQQPLSPSQRDWVGQIQTAGWHLLEMINDTLDLSRIESGTLKLSMEPMDLQQVISATLSMVERTAQARGVTVTQSVAPHAAQVSGDPTRVKQILTNLLTNAVKYNVDGGRVHVEARLAAPDEIEVSVSDNGLGMSEEQLAGLFQPFNRLGRERSAQEGTGIGLVISQRLAELMGGTLRVRSLEGEGSTFTLTLPRAAVREPLPSADDADEQQNHDYRHRIVHYIEDNETNAVVMEGILAQRPQVRLRVSSAGLEGLAAVRAQPPSLILLDMHLPDIDGLQLLRLLKDDLDTASIPVVAVSADAVNTRIQAALDIGAEYYLTKPVNVAELLRIVDELLEQRDTLFG